VRTHPPDGARARESKASHRRPLLFQAFVHGIVQPRRGNELMFLRPHLERLITLLRLNGTVIIGAAIAIDLAGDRAMVPAQQFRDTTSRIFPTQLAGNRLPFLGAQRHAPTHQSSPQKRPRKGDTLADQNLLR
jgi:hypothetical protein